MPSVAIAWCFDDERTDFTEGVLDLLSVGTEVLTPAIWLLEVANALLIAERRKRVSMAQVTGSLRRIAGLPISVDPIEPTRAFDQIISVACQQNLTEYDAAYIELALRRTLPLATLDDKLRQVAEHVGITLIAI
jgi:predicted nucleic acid-binding protein